MNKTKLIDEFIKLKTKKENRGVYYSADDYINDCKNFIKDIKKRNVIMSMQVSKSGTVRMFNSLHYNMLLNIIYNNKMTWDKVKVGGCGMDMQFHLLFTVCSHIVGYEKANVKLNSMCGGQPLL